ncbi:MAG: BMC domain-containing protein [Eubacteriaceae bacterium]|jgi:ethanolamine utilization protein EutS
MGIGEDILKSNEGKLRIIQETVPGKQVTLAHIIASPDAVVYQKLGLNPSVDYSKAAIGILSMTPPEIAVIAGDIALKSSPIDVGFIDRFSGTLIFTGRISDVKSSVNSILNYLKYTLGFTICDVTST